MAKKKRKGTPHTPEWIEANRQRHLGRKRSPETCRRISEAKKGKKQGPRSPEWCANISRARKGKKHSESHRLHNSEAQKKKHAERPNLRWAAQTPEAKQKRANSLKHIRTPEWWDHFHARMRNNPNVQAALNKGHKFWRTPSPERDAKLIKLVQASRSSTKPSGIEKAMQAELLRLDIPFIVQYPFDKYSVDFYLPDFHLAIECDGDYWHRSRKVRSRDRKRDKFLAAKYGVQTARVRETHIRKNLAGVVKALMYLRSFYE